MTTNDNIPSCSTLAKGNQPEQLGNNDLAIAVGLAQGRIVRSRTLECSWVKVLRVEHSRVNLFDGQLR